MPPDKTEAGVGAGAGGRHGVRLSPDMLANIHGRLSFVDHAFASVFHESRDAFKPEAPWLIFPGETQEKVRLFSLADRRATAVRAPYALPGDHAFLGSSGGWLATADGRGRMGLVNPVTGKQRALPAITTIPCLQARRAGDLFVFDLKPFARGPPYVGGWEPCGTFTLTAAQIRTHLYRKVVLADGGHGDGAAMLITGERFGVAAFATADDAAWRLAPSPHGVEDAIHHDGRFYSVTYTGTVEVWERQADTGVFTRAAITPSIGNSDNDSNCRRKYLVAAPGGRLMVVLKHRKKATDECNKDQWTPSFKVQVLDREQWMETDDIGDREQWMETDDIGDAALFVGANESLCVSTRVHQELKPGHVYHTEDDLSQASSWKDAPRYGDDGQRGVGVFCLKDGTVENVEGQGQHGSWPPLAWFTPTMDDAFA